MAPVTVEMKYYHVSIAACRHTLIDFFTPKPHDPWACGYKAFLPIPAYLVIYVCIRRNECNICQEGVPPIPGTLLGWLLK